MLVKEKNDWEHRTYFVGDVQLSPDRDKFLLVRWPDGSEERCKIWWRRETYHYSDHGNPGSATSDVPYVELNVHGVAVSVKLSSASIEVIL